MASFRRVEAEWLDELPVHDPRAQRSRRDLVRINALMGNARSVAREIEHELPAGFASIAEIGAGSGAFLARLAGRLARRDVVAHLVDRQDVVAPEIHAALASRGWTARAHQRDACEWLAEAPPLDVVVANLFLHH